ncbi:MAG: response regulator [Terracidiphilus sp.]|jgi:CheY-like chemotaxis protein
MHLQNESEKCARILVVDDDQLIALTIGAILKDEGYKVFTAFSGEEAVAKSREVLPNLLLSDINMGAMNGIEAAARITAELPHCKVLFLSGHSSMSDVLNAAPERLVYSYVSKPVPPLDLINAIAYLLSAENSADKPPAISVQPDTIARENIGWMRVATGLKFREGQDWNRVFSSRSKFARRCVLLT